jgi:hypothetical protein
VNSAGIHAGASSVFYSLKTNILKKNLPIEDALHSPHKIFIFKKPIHSKKYARLMTRMALSFSTHNRCYRYRIVGACRRRVYDAAIKAVIVL